MENIDYTVDSFDYSRFSSTSKDGGFIVLKVGRFGYPHAIKLQISEDLKMLSWKSKSFGYKFGTTNTMLVNKIKNLSMGQTTPQFARWLGKGPGAESLRSRSFSIFYTDIVGIVQSLDVIAKSDSDCTYAYEAVESLVTEANQIRANTPPDLLYIQDMWEKADRNGSGKLSKSEVLSVIEMMNITMPSQQLQKIFKEVDENATGELDLDEFTKLIQRLRERPEMKILWGFILRNEVVPSTIPDNVVNEDIRRPITLAQFIRFWSIHQREAIDEAAAIKLIESESKSTLDKKNPIISYEMWLKVIESRSNDAFRPTKSVIYQDMSRPLSHYWIASSHNTYLTGDQLQSNSSVNRYVSDLESGCRCVELDCWDGEHGEPIIYHGHTLTSKINFVEVISAIRDHGFKTTPYPIILSIENHLSYEQQEIAARMCREILGEFLAIPPSSLGSRLPAPSELINKVLIKGKKGFSPPDDEIDEEEEEDTLEGKAAVQKKKSMKKAEAEKLKAPKSKGTHPDLTAITYLGTGKVKEFKADGNADIPCDSMCSFSEGATFKNLKSADKIANWTLHNERHISRIYPAGARIDSSNYDPAPAWLAGNHLVALNYQTPDIPMHVNRGRFRENGKCGYVLKPDYMLSGPAGKLPLPRAVKLTFTVLSGSQLPKAHGSEHGQVINPYVNLSLHGSATEHPNSKTKVIQDNGFNPVWNEKFEFEVDNPEVAVLNLEVIHEFLSAPYFIAFAALPVRCLAPGIRTCSLFDAVGERTGDYIFASLTVIVDIQLL